MFEKKDLNDLVQRLVDSLPPGVAKLPKDIEKNFHAVLQSTFHKVNLVTREEFDAQTKVLQRTRAKLEHLEKKIQELEDQ
jgi:BMFP domain-containing protein YqiC